MIETNRLRESIERWLVHENYKFTENKSSENTFHLLIKHFSIFGTPIEIFQPLKQPNVIVIGRNVPLKNSQNARYLKLNDDEQKKFEKKVGDFCYSIKAIHKILDENGKKMVGVYVVLDDENKFNQQDFVNALEQVVEMSEKTTQFLMKTF